MRGPKSFDLEDMTLLKEGSKIMEQGLEYVYSGIAQLSKSWNRTTSEYESRFRQYLSDEGLSDRLYVHIEPAVIVPTKPSLSLREIKGIAWDPIGFTGKEIGEEQVNRLEELMSGYVTERKEIDSAVNALANEADRHYKALESLCVIEDPFGQDLTDECVMFVKEPGRAAYHRCDVHLVDPAYFVMDLTDVPVNSFRDRKLKKALSAERAEGRNVYVLHMSSPMLHLEPTLFRAVQYLRDMYAESFDGDLHEPHMVSAMRGGPDLLVYNKGMVSPQELQMMGLRAAFEQAAAEQGATDLGFVFGPPEGDDDDTLH